MGDTDRVRYSGGDRSGLLYLLDRLLTGEDVSDKAFRHWGLQVRVEEDEDQGPEDLRPLVEPPDWAHIGSIANDSDNEAPSVTNNQVG